jgi:hypothetical protein
VIAAEGQGPPIRHGVKKAEGRQKKAAPEGIENQEIAARLRISRPTVQLWRRTMAKAQGVSEATVRRIWQRHNLKPHRLETTADLQLRRNCISAADPVAPGNVYAVAVAACSTGKVN